MQEIRNDFMPRNMASVFIESSMTHKSLHCLNLIYRNGVLQELSLASVSKDMNKWSKEAEDIDKGWERNDGLTYGVRVKQVNSYACCMVESYENRTKVESLKFLSNLVLILVYIMIEVGRYVRYYSSY